MLHVMTFDLKLRDVVDFSFHAETSRPLTGLESWMNGLPEDDTLTAFWNYK